MSAPLLFVLAAAACLVMYGFVRVACWLRLTPHHTHHHVHPRTRGRL